MTRRLGFRTALTILQIDNDHDQNPIVLVQSSRFAVAVSVSVPKRRKVEDELVSWHEKEPRWAESRGLCS